MPGAVGAGGDGSAPYFFLSYAHTPKNHPEDKDPNIWVERFHRDLCAHVLQLTSLPAGAQAGYMYRQTVTGAGCQDQLSQALAYCSVFVPLYSPKYFLSEQCGREWFVFSQRQNRRQQHGGSSGGRGIVPALWVPVAAKQLPQAAEQLDFDHAAFGDDYADEGFYGLIKLRYLRDQYERSVYLLAKRIVSVAEQERIAEGDPRQDYGSVPSAFGPPGPARELEVSVLACSRSDRPEGRAPDCYGSRPRDWNPYHPASSRPLADHAVDLIRNLDYRVSVGDFETEAERLLAPGPPQAPGLLLLDRWALDAPFRRELLRRLCAEDRPWISVIIPWNRDDPDSAHREAELSAVTEESLAPRPQEAGGHRSAIDRLPTLEAFSRELPAAVKAADKHYVAHARTYPPQGPRNPIPRVLPSGVGFGAGVPASTAREADRGQADHGQGA
ncbi:TIR-like protein FxsC [Streptomyces sp.]|uniref:TIR-like protein FxsC n=1 Tax=Streptomyces sp. TaxID=1931 RepID=UPI002D77759A|nr:TIR-like protein FxsC [Streptomyces sp.]HET6355329.1 TIR-like protein FxsC [Streptomyces sp.]